MTVNGSGIMCERGHTLSFVRTLNEGQCILCEKAGNMEQLEQPCRGCCQYEKVYGKVQNVNENKYTFCSDCAKNNGNKVRAEWKRDETKRKIIRNILKASPSLSLDILTGLPRAQAFYGMGKELQMIDKGKRMYYSVWMIDLDNFKAMNSAYTPKGADEVIVIISEILKRIWLYRFVVLCFFLCAKYNI